jgi:hypothetical protein
MKNVTMLACVCLALVLLAGPALAGGEGGVISLTGEILALPGDKCPDDWENCPDPDSMWVRVQMANVPFAGWRGSRRLVMTNSDTVFLGWEGSVAGEISFTDLELGDWASINGVVDGDMIEARRVEVNKPRIPSSLIK